MGQRYHLVCHHCPEEGVYTERDVADEQKASHTTKTDHEMTLRAISPEPVA
jgi:hypothetical protein